MRTIVITGGSHGLGKAIAAKYAKDNTVVILAPDKDRLDATAQEIGCESEVCNVSDWNSVNTAVQNVLQKHGQINVLINNAGLYSRGSIENIDPDETERLFRVNSVGPLLMSKAVVPSMKQHQAGTIININSQDGVVAKVDRSVYSGSKWALTGITKCLQAELAPFGIKVTGIYPGAMEMSMESGGGAEPRPAGISYKDVLGAIDYALNLEGSTFVTELGVKHLEN